MTWKIDSSTGELINPNGDVVTVLDGPPYSTRQAKNWANDHIRSMQMADLTTEDLVNFAELWQGDVDSV